MTDTSSRLGIVSRVAAAVVCGYVLSSLTAVCLALLLPMARSEAVLVATMSSFIVYLCAALWAFAAADAARAWIGLAACAGLLGAALLVFRPGALG